MEGFNYQINESNEGGDAIDHLGFINRNDFSNSDVDQVLFEAQDSLLNSIEPINGCQDSSSFLNPINDILSDINEFSKNFCCDQVGAFQSLQPSSVPQQNMNDYNNSWAIQENAETSAVPSYVNLSDMSKSENGAHNGVENGYFNMNSGNDNTVMLPETAVEFPGTDCAFLGGEYSSTINQWFQTLEQQQMSFMTAPLSTVHLPTHIPQSALHPSQGYTDTFLSTIGSLPASTTITPITVDEHQLIHRPVSPVQQEVTIEARFAAPRNSVLQPNTGEKANMIPMINQMQQQQHEESQKPKLIPNVEQMQVEWRQGGGSFSQQPSICQLQGSSVSSTHSKAMLHSNLVPFAAAQQLFQRKSSAANLTSRRIPSIGFQKNRLHWTAVFPRKHFIQPPEMIIMHPLRTRKLMASRRAVPSSCGSSATINLAEYFDTSSIDIPMIRERSRTENKNENRRKQKLHIIPGSENLIFEVQRNDFNDSSEFIHIAPSVGEQYNAEIDPYPETELPELDEIFKRKKKTTSVPGAGNKRTCHISQTLNGSVGGVVGVGAPPPKKPCQNSFTQPVPLQESSASFEEKISVSIAIRKGRSNISIDKNDLIYSSESESGESDDEKGKTDAQSGKSLKCQKCRKLFKTTRSLAIHTKRCTATPCESSAFSETQSSHEEDDTNINDSTNNNNSSCSSNNSENYKRNMHNSNTELKNPPKLNRMPQENSLEIHLNSSANYEDEIYLRMTGSNDENKARPITRSQTRRSTGRSIQVTNTIKRSK